MIKRKRRGYYSVAGDPKDLALAKESVHSSLRAYDDPGYGDTHTSQYTAVKIPMQGVRSQGHSMVLVWILSGLLPSGEKLTPGTRNTGGFSLLKDKRLSSRAAMPGAFPA